MQWYDYLRITTAVLSIVAAYRLALLAKKDYKTYTKRLSEFVWILFATFFTLFAANIEAILKGNDWRYSALLTFFIALAGVRATRDDGPLQKFGNT